MKHSIAQLASSITRRLHNLNLSLPIAFSITALAVFSLGCGGENLPEDNGSMDNNLVAGGASAKCLNGWRKMPSGTNARLLALGGSGSTNIYAAGVGGLRRFNGKTWSAVNLGPARPGLVLEGVWAASSSQVFAVGHFQRAGVMIGVAYRWDGKRWSSA